MASVHYGRLVGPAGFSRVVAIKRLHPQLAALTEFVTMFFDEVRLTARIRHPNVVPTLDAVYENGELFLVMEYVHGESLSTLIRLARERGEFVPPLVATSIVCGILHGLHAVHEARDEHGAPLDIVHRDVSPQNVIVGFDGMARILDFGIAKAAGRAHSTRDGYLKGKMAYLAPEVVHGESTDRRVDVYAAAAVLWETLTGGRLFDGENDSVVLARVLEGAVPAPSPLAEGVSPALDAVTLKGLERDPSARYPTAREMALALQKEVGTLATSEVGDWVERLAHETRRERELQLAALERMEDVPDAPSAARSDGLPATIIMPFPSNAIGAERTEQNGREPTTRPVARSASSTAAFEAIRETPDARNDRGRFAALALSVLTGLGVAIFFLARSTSSSDAAHAAALGRPSEAATATTGTAGAATAVATATTAAVASTQTPAPTAVKRAVPDPATSAVPVSRPPLPAVSRAVPTPTTKNRRSPKVERAAIDCQPPFTIDASGVKHFKLECFK
jgi:serine/threonine-protein kinase